MLGINDDGDFIESARNAITELSSSQNGEARSLVLSILSQDEQQQREIWELREKKRKEFEQNSKLPPPVPQPKTAKQILFEQEVQREAYDEDEKLIQLKEEMNKRRDNLSKGIQPEIKPVQQIEREEEVYVEEDEERELREMMDKRRRELATPPIVTPPPTITPPQPPQPPPVQEVYHELSSVLLRYSDEELEKLKYRIWIEAKTRIESMNKATGNRLTKEELEQKICDEGNKLFENHLMAVRDGYIKK